MTATQWLICMFTVVALIYAGTAVAYQYAGRPGMMLVFVGYVIANIGLIWDAIG